jgi:predicted ATP-grasp superfamily ATP-dependent carboligase
VSGDYYLEEYVMDKIAYTGLWNVQPIQKYQVGEWYTPVAEFTDEELKSVYFWHEHILHDPKYNKVREKVEFFNRTRALRD